MRENNESLVLYHFETCPYCIRVRDFIDKHGIKAAYRNTKKDAGARDELISLGGKSQVPCLVIDGRALYESKDIINWLQKNVVEAQSAVSV